MIGDYEPVARGHSHDKVPVFKVRHAFCILAPVCMHTDEEELMAMDYQ